MQSEHFQNEKASNSELETLINKCTSLKNDMDTSVGQTTPLVNVRGRLIVILDEAIMCLEDMIARKENKENIRALLLKLQELANGCRAYNEKFQQKLPAFIFVDILVMVKVFFYFRLPLLNDEDSNFKDFIEAVKDYICKTYSEHDMFKEPQDTGSNFALGDLHSTEKEKENKSSGVLKQMLEDRIEKSANQMLKKILQQRIISKTNKDDIKIDSEDFHELYKAMQSGNFDLYKEIFWELYDFYKTKFLKNTKSNPDQWIISKLISITLRAISTRSFTGPNMKRAFDFANKIFGESVSQEFFLPKHAELMMNIYAIYKKPEKLALVVSEIMQLGKISSGFIKARISVCLNVGNSVSDKTKKAYDELRKFYLSCIKNKTFAGFSEIERIDIACIMLIAAVNNNDFQLAEKINSELNQQKNEGNKLLIDSNVVRAFHRGDLLNILKVYNENKNALNQFDLPQHCLQLLCLLAEECATDEVKYRTIAKPLIVYILLNNKLKQNELYFVLGLILKANDFEFLIFLSKNFIGSNHDATLYYALIDAYVALDQKNAALYIIKANLPTIRPFNEDGVKVYDFHGVSVNYVKVFLEDLIPKLEEGNYGFITGKGNHTNEKNIKGNKSPLKRAASEILRKFDHIEILDDDEGIIKFKIKKPSNTNEVSSPSATPKVINIVSKTTNPWNKTIKELPPIETSEVSDVNEEAVPPLIPIAETSGSEIIPPATTSDAQEAVATPEKISITISADKAKPAPWLGVKPSENASIGFFSASNETNLNIIFDETTQIPQNLKEPPTSKKWKEISKGEKVSLKTIIESEQPLNIQEKQSVNEVFKEWNAVAQKTPDSLIDIQKQQEVEKKSNQRPVQPQIQILKRETPIQTTPITTSTKAPSKMSATAFEFKPKLNTNVASFTPKTNSPQNPAPEPKTQWKFNASNYLYEGNVLVSQSTTTNSFFPPKPKEQTEKENQASWDSLMQNQLAIVQKKKENQIATVQVEAESLQEEIEPYESEWSQMVQQVNKKNW